MIVDLGKAIKFLTLPCKIRRLISENYVNGELVPTYTADENLKLVVMPMSGRELRNYAEGEFDYNDIIVFQDSESLFLKPKDRIYYKGNWFEVRTCVDLEDYVNIKKFTGKRIAIKDVT